MTPAEHEDAIKGLLTKAHGMGLSPQELVDSAQVHATLTAAKIHAEAMGECFALLSEALRNLTSTLHGITQEMRNHRPSRR